MTKFGRGIAPPPNRMVPVRFLAWATAWLKLKNLVQTLIQYLACQVAYNSSCLTRKRALRKLLYKPLLLNFHQLSCNSCSRSTRTRELRKTPVQTLINCHTILWPGHESWENSYTNVCFSTFINSCNSCSSSTRTQELRKTPVQTLINCHTILVLVWPGHESWENSHTNSRSPTLIQLLFLFD